MEGDGRRWKEMERKQRVQLEDGATKRIQSKIGGITVGRWHENLSQYLVIVVPINYGVKHK